MERIDTRSTLMEAIQEIQKNVVDVFFDESNITSFAASKGYKLKSIFTGAEFNYLTQEVLDRNIALIGQYMVSHPELLASPRELDVLNTFKPVIENRMSTICKVERIAGSESLLTMAAKWFLDLVNG